MDRLCNIALSTVLPASLHAFRNARVLTQSIILFARLSPRVVKRPLRFNARLCTPGISFWICSQLLRRRQKCRFRGLTKICNCSTSFMLGLYQIELASPQSTMSTKVLQIVQGSPASAFVIPSTIYRGAARVERHGHSRCMYASAMRSDWALDELRHGISKHDTLPQTDKARVARSPKGIKVRCYALLRYLAHAVQPSPSSSPLLSSPISKGHQPQDDNCKLHSH